MHDVHLTWRSGDSITTEAVPLAVIPEPGDEVPHPQKENARLIVSSRFIEPNRVTCICHATWEEPTDAHDGNI